MTEDPGDNPSVSASAPRRPLHAAPLVAAAAAGVGAIMVVDVATGEELSVVVLYFFPIFAAGWWAGMRSALFVALVAALAWGAADRLTHEYSRVWIWYWNTGVRLATFLTIAVLTARLRTALRIANDLARHDPLTGLHNLRALLEHLDPMLELTRRHARPFTAAYLDLDNFKQVNDRRGHAAGDALLRRVGHALRVSLRAGDLCARVGGDEFVIVLPETDRPGGEAVLTRLHAAVQAALEDAGDDVGATIGALTFTSVPENSEAVLRRVDALMYAAKAQGKRRVVFG